MTQQTTKTKGLRIATRCTSLDQFVTAFNRFCDAQTFFISTLATRPVGLETAFSVELADHTPALRGIGVVIEAWTTPKNPYGRPGLQLGIRRLTADSEPVFERLRRARAAAPAPAAQPPALAQVVVRPSRRPASQPTFGGPADTTLATTEAPRTPGSELVLPANPLMNLTDESLEGFVDCTLYEETANFFPVPDEDVSDDPLAAPPVPDEAARRASIEEIASPLELASPPNSIPMPEPVLLPAASLEPAMAAGTVRPAGTRITLPPAPAKIPPTILAATESPALSVRSPAQTLSPIAFVAPPSAPHRATPPGPLPLSAVLGRGATEPAEPLEIEPDAASGAQPLPIARPSLDTLLANMPAPDAAILSQHHATRDPAGSMPQPLAPVPGALPADDDLDVPPGGWRGKRRWLIGGGAAVATITIATALVFASRSHDSDAKAAVPAPQLVASNLPHLPEAALPGDHARSSVVDARSTPPPPDDGGAAPVFGSGPCKIAVSTTPAGSIITVDGEPAGPSPITLGGPCKPRKIDIAHPRYQSVTRTVTGTPATEPLEVTLARPTHDLYVDTQPAGATISIDGHHAGISPTIVKIMGFTTIAITIEKPGFKAQTKKLYSKTAHDKTSIKLVREGKPGALSTMVRSNL